MLDYWMGKMDMIGEEEGELEYFNPTDRLLNGEGSRRRDSGCR